MSAATGQIGGVRPGRRLTAWHIAFLLLIILFCVFPFYWMVTTSLKTQIVALSTPPAWTFDPTLL